MCNRDQRFGDDNGGCCIAMTGLRNWRPRRRRRKREISLRSRRLQRRRQLRKQKIQHIWVNFYDEWTSTTTKAPLSSPNLWSLLHIVYSLTSSKASVIVVNSVGQAVKDYLPLGSWLHIYSCDIFHLWLLGVVFRLTLLDTEPLKTVEVKTEYLDYFSRNVQSFGLSLICVFSNKNKTRKRSVKLSRQWKNT